MPAFTRALMAKPRLMLQDEPTMGLSRLMVSLIADILEAPINQTRVSALLAEKIRPLLFVWRKKDTYWNTGVSFSGANKEIRDNKHVKQAYLEGWRHTFIT